MVICLKHPGRHTAYLLHTCTKDKLQIWRTAQKKALNALRQKTRAEVTCSGHTCQNKKESSYICNYCVNVFLCVCMCNMLRSYHFCTHIDCTGNSQVPERITSIWMFLILTIFNLMNVHSTRTAAVSVAYAHHIRLACGGYHAADTKKYEYAAPNRLWLPSGHHAFPTANHALHFNVGYHIVVVYAFGAPPSLYMRI